MQSYKYIDQTGQTKEIEAETPEIAIANATNRDTSSGVQLVQPTTVTPDAGSIPVPTQNTGVPTQAEPTVGEIGGFSPQEAFDPFEAERKEAQGYLSNFKNQKSDAQIRREVMKQFQSQIDSTRNIYGEQLKEAFREGQNRVGTAEARQARGGLLGSSFGAAQDDKVLNYNQDIARGIRAEQAAAINVIMGEATQASVDRIKERNEALRLGATNYLNFLKGDEDRRNANTNAVIAAMIAKGVDVSEMTTQELEELAKTLNTTTQDVLARYDEASAVETESKSGFSLSAGQSRFDAEGNLIASVDKPVSEPNMNQMTDNERAFFGQFRGEPIVKDFNTTLNKKQSVDAILENGIGGPADLALVFEFMKGLDPTSVVRESEYDAAAKSGNIFSGIYAKFNGYLKPEGGILPEAVKKEFGNIVNSKLEVTRQQYDNVASEYRRIAEAQGLNPDNVVISYENAFGGGQQEPSFSQEEQSAIEEMRGDGLSDEDISAIFGREISFNKGGNLPQRNNNPGNIKSGGLADQYAIGTDEQGHLIFPNAELGFKAMQEDVGAKVNGNSRHIGANPTIQELGSVYAEDPNWGNAVASILGVDKNTRTQDIPLSELTQAIARQEGFYA